MAKERAPEIPVRFYRTDVGNEPVLEWLRSLDKADRRTIGLDLMRVQFGWPAGMPLVRSLKGGYGKFAPPCRASGLHGCFCAFIAVPWWCFMASSKRSRRRQQRILRWQGDG